MVEKERHPTAAVASRDFVAAFRMVLAHDLDRRMLLELAAAGHELRYEELRRAVHEDSKQLFQYAVDRMVMYVLARRRLEPWGDRYQTHLSPTPRGLLVSRILRDLGQRGRLPADLDENLRHQVQTFFMPPLEGLAST